MASLLDLGAQVRTAALRVALASTDQKNAGLDAAADQLIDRQSDILSANAHDVEAGVTGGLAPTAIDRLRLDDARIASMAQGLRELIALPDPVGEITDGWSRPNGLSIRRVRVPLGVVGVIYENRPNVTSDAAGLCLKSGNGAFLRGSSAALESNKVIVDALQAGLRQAGLPPEAVTLVEDVSRESAVEFMRMRDYIDCLVPRGGAGLIASVLENATVPYVIDGDGNCHVYVDAAADLAMAEAIVVNAKTQRPSVCNAAESLVVHADVAEAFLPRIVGAMPQVEFVGDKEACAIAPSIASANDDDFAKEFLDLKMSVAVVPDIDAAIAHVNHYSTGHTEAIVTANIVAAQRFTREVDAAVVAVNASTRFTDGNEFGFGAEIGNSTQKLHCRGPMGLREMTTLKYIVEGNGQVRT